MIIHHLAVLSGNRKSKQKMIIIVVTSSLISIVMTKMKTELYIYFFIYVLKLIILEIMNGLVQLFPFYFQEYNFFKLINKIIFKSLIL